MSRRGRRRRPLLRRPDSRDRAPGRRRLVFARTPDESPPPWPRGAADLVHRRPDHAGLGLRRRSRRPRGRGPAPVLGFTTHVLARQTQPLHARCDRVLTEGGPHPGAGGDAPRRHAARPREARPDGRRVRRASWTRRTRRLLRRLEPDAALRPEVEGDLTVVEPAQGRAQERDRGHRDRGALARHDTTTSRSRWPSPARSATRPSTTG